jgi:aryl-alcohol dehydrogenase-like predicted oxidoreductase
MFLVPILDRKDIHLKTSNFSSRIIRYSSSLMAILDRKEKAARDAFNTSIDGGLTFFDTAEVYGSGVSAYLI